MLAREQGGSPIKVTSARIVLALAILALALSAPALADGRPDPSPPKQPIGMQCSVVNFLFATEHKCLAQRHCFEGLGIGTPELAIFAFIQSYGHLYVVDDQIFRNTSSFQYNYAGPYTNLNFFANLTHRLGSFHGGGAPGGVGAIGGGLGQWRDVSEEPGGQCGRLGKRAPVAVGSGPVMARPQRPSPWSGSVGAGHRSPATAVAGFVKGFNHRNPRKACSYAKPSLRHRCRSAFRRFGRFNIRVRHFKVVSSRRSGNRARVKVKGDECLGARCRPLRSASGRHTVTVSAKRVGGKWYVS
jgi:hypothetical protein